ncbi:hypothetical protein AB7M18_000612 [Pseudomonas viridiflava]
MNNDLMRLSDLVPAYSRFHKVSDQEAAYALHELIEELYVEHGVNRFRPNSINDIFWVGSLGGFERSTRLCMLYFQSLSKYFYDLFESSSVDQKDLLSCYSEFSQQSVNIPAKVVCFSRVALFEWIVDAGFKAPQFILAGDVNKVGEVKGGDGFSEKELGSISRLMNGLVDIIKAVDQAHREPPANYHGKMPADNIKGYAYMLSNPPRQNSDVYNILISLAEEAGVDIPTDKTLKKYMRKQPKPF